MTATVPASQALPEAPVAGQSPSLMAAEPATHPLMRASLRALGGAREAAIVREAQRGSEEALGELFRRHWRRAHRAAYLVVGDSAAAEDIAQESFLAAIRALDRFDRRRPLGPWLHRITVNRAIDYARARRLRAERALPNEAEGEAPASPGLSDELVAALAALSPSIVPLSSFATCSSTPRGRSLACWTFPAAPLTPASAGPWTACVRQSTGRGHEARA